MEATPETGIEEGRNRRAGTRVVVTTMTMNWMTDLEEEEGRRAEGPEAVVRFDEGMMVALAVAEAILKMDITEVSVIIGWPV